MGFTRILFLTLFFVCAADVRCQNVKIFNVKKYGAIPGGKTENSKGFLEAWKNACQWKGKAVVLVPAGTYLLDSVKFEGECKGYMIFKLKGNVMAVSKLKDIDRWITFKYVNGFTLAGRGTFDGQGHKVWPCKKNGKCQTLPISLRFEFIKNGNLQNIRSINSQNAHVSIFASSNLNISNIKSASRIQIRDITFSNIRGTSRSKAAVTLSCSSVVPCKNIVLKDIKLVYTGINGVPAGLRQYHDGRPRGPLWRGKKLIGKEALFVILGLKRFKNDDDEKLDRFIKTHVFRLLKLDIIAVLSELERQEEVSLAVKVGSFLGLVSDLLVLQIFRVIQKQDWYKPDVFLYKDLIMALLKTGKMDEAMKLWEDMRNEDLFPDSQMYTETIRGYLRDGSPADAMNIYEDMKKSPDPPEELPFRILLKGLLPHPLLRSTVKQDYEELFPEKHVYDPPEEIFGML
ncbi:hypothetical protein OIU84_008645 [Salix udensis]|uniref:Polygalacturonase n=1 Tax=Salix udensis TaxID=889485 RepID=A0AAD6JRN4_9ROSI|nr:hypothetical protein OIU84_008645 [Salix udensis]